MSAKKATKKAAKKKPAKKKAAPTTWTLTIHDDNTITPPRLNQVRHGHAIKLVLANPASCFDISFRPQKVTCPDRGGAITIHS